MDKRAEYKGFFYIFIFFISYYFILSSGHFTIGDEFHTYWTTQSLITKGYLSIPSNVYPAVTGKGGKFYTHKGIGQSILAVPYYITGSFLEKISAAKFVGVLAKNKADDIKNIFLGDIKIFAVSQFNIHISALICCVFYLFSLRLGFSIRTSILSALIAGTSTIVCAYSKFFFDQPLSCLTILTSLYFIFLEKKRYNILIAGLFMGAGILARAENIIFMPFFICYIYLKENSSLFKFKLNKEIAVKMVVFLLPAITAILLNRYINYLKFGDIMQDGMPQGLGYWFSQGRLLTGLYGHLFSVGKSIFILSPPLILSIFYIKRFLVDQKLKAVILYSACACFLLFYSKYLGWHGGWCWGSRFLHVIIPFLLLPLGYFIEKMFIQKRAWQVALLGFLILTGIFVQVLGMTPKMNDIIYDSWWSSIINNQHYIDEDIYGTMCVFIPSISPIKLHWKNLFEGNLIDYWYYYIYKNYGLGRMIIFMIIPLTGIAVSIRGIFRTIKSSDQTQHIA